MLSSLLSAMMRLDEMLNIQLCNIQLVFNFRVKSQLTVKLMLIVRGKNVQ